MLEEKVSRHQTDFYLVNTGWSAAIKRGAAVLVRFLPSSRLNYNKFAISSAAVSMRAWVSWKSLGTIFPGKTTAPFPAAVLLISLMACLPPMDFYLKAGYNSTDKTAFIQWIE